MELTPLQQVMVFAGIPALLCLILALAILAPGWTRAGRYRPGEPWNYDPILINGSNTNDVAQAIAATPTGELGEVVESEPVEATAGAEGGTSARW